MQPYFIVDIKVSSMLNKEGTDPGPKNLCFA